MLFHSIAEINILSAEETTTATSTEGNEPKRRRRRASASTRNTATKDTTGNLVRSTEKSLTAAAESRNVVDAGGRKYLTSLGNEDILGDDQRRAKSVKVYAELAKQKDLYTDSLDVLGPDDTSPVLAESVFGVKGKQRVNLIADDIEVKVLMDRLASDFKLNIVSNAVTGRQKMKASLYDLPLETVFQVLLEQANLTYEKRSGIVYLQERGKGQDSFLTERFFKLKEYADFSFAGDLISNIATTKGNKIITNTQNKTIFVSEYQRNLDKIEKVLGELGYLDDLDPDSSTFYYHYLGFNYVDDSVVKDIVDKYKSKDGKASYDAKSNRYLVFDTKVRFEKMRKALTFVDVPRGQVFIDVIFVDLTENDSKRLGMNTTFDWNPNSPDNADQLVTTLATDVTNFFNYKQPTHITSIRATGIKEHSNSNIINNPRLMVLNNEKAVIDVTEKFPYVINENNNGVISSKIQNQDIGVKLDVTPRINSNREVQLAVKPTITVLKEVKNIVTSVVDTNQANARVTETSSEFPITDERSIDTQVVVPSGRTLVIGGLIKETDRKSADQIPGLGRLPIFGPLFRRKTSGEEKSQLYIFITPTIVRNAPESSTYSATAGNERLTFFPKGKTSSVNSDGNRLVIEKSDTGSKRGKINSLEVVGDKQESSSHVADASDNQLVAKSVKSDKVDFSSFIKKIAALKQKERVQKLESQKQVVAKAKTQKGFENLIDQLQVDINEETKQYEKMIEEKKKEPRNDLGSSNRSNSKAPSLKVENRKEQIVADKVVGQRASRIARLLELWEKQPVEGIMTGEDVKRERERERIAAEEAEKARIENEKKQSEIEAKRAVEIAEEKAKKEEPVVVPIVEQAIKMNMLSPQGEMRYEQRELIKVGDFQTGDLEGSKSKNRKEKRGSKANNQDVEGQVSVEQDKSEKRNRRLKNRKTSYLRESFELKLDNSSLSMAEKSLSNEESNEHFVDMSKLPNEFNEISTEKQIESSKSKSNNLNLQAKQAKSDVAKWEKDFFEKDLAKVVFTEIQEVLDLDDSPTVVQRQRNSSKEVNKPVKQKSPPNDGKIFVKNEKPVQKRRVATSKPMRRSKPAKTQITSKDPKTQQIFDNLMRSQKAVASDRTKITVNSNDPRTQKIFNELFDVPKPKVDKVKQARLSKVDSRPANNENMNNNIVIDKNLSKQERSERAFESFLDQMFVAPKASTDRKSDSNKNNHKTAKVKKSLATKAEEELVDFLDNL